MSGQTRQQRRAQASGQNQIHSVRGGNNPSASSLRVTRARAAGLATHCGSLYTARLSCENSWWLSALPARPRDREATFCKNSGRARVCTAVAGGAGGRAGENGTRIRQAGCNARAPNCSSTCSCMLSNRLVMGILAIVWHAYLRAKEKASGAARQVLTCYSCPDARAEGQVRGRTQASTRPVDSRNT